VWINVPAASGSAAPSVLPYTGRTLRWFRLPDSLSIVTCQADYLVVLVISVRSVAGVFGVVSVALNDNAAVLRLVVGRCGADAFCAIHACVRAVLLGP